MLVCRLVGLMLILMLLFIFGDMNIEVKLVWWWLFELNGDLCIRWCMLVLVFSQLQVQLFFMCSVVDLMLVMLLLDIFISLVFQLCDLYQCRYMCSRILVQFWVLVLLVLVWMLMKVVVLFIWLENMCWNFSCFMCFWYLFRLVIMVSVVLLFCLFFVSFSSLLDLVSLFRMEVMLLMVFFRLVCLCFRFWVYLVLFQIFGFFSFWVIFFRCFFLVLQLKIFFE